MHGLHSILVYAVLTTRARTECITYVTITQAEHERTQSRLFELESRRDSATVVAQSDAELAAEDTERTQRVIGCAQVQTYTNEVLCLPAPSMQCVVSNNRPEDALYSPHDANAWKVGSLGPRSFSLHAALLSRDLQRERSQLQLRVEQLSQDLQSVPPPVKKAGPQVHTSLLALLTQRVLHIPFDLTGGRSR